MAPQLRQSLKILQVPTLDLRATILEELQTNPVLEELPGSEVSIEAEAEASESEGEETSSDQEAETIPTDLEQADATEGEAGEDGPSETADEIDFGEDEFAILREMEEDLREHFAQEYDEGTRSGNNVEAEQKRKFFFDSIVSEPSLQEHLLDQLKLADLNEGWLIVFGHGQEHKSGWEVDEMKDLGFQVYGQGGLKYLRGERARIKYRPEFFWSRLSYISQKIVEKNPKYSFQLLCVNNLDVDKK